MPSREDDALTSTAQPEVATGEQQTSGGSYWWLVWIPLIVVVVLWIGGWSFGNYGGPWGVKPSSAPPAISAPSVILSNCSL